MITTHSLAEATLRPVDPELAMLELLPPGPILTEVPPEPAVAEPLSPPAPIEVEVEPAPEDVPLAVVPAFPAFSVRQGCWLSTMIVVPPLLPLTIETLAPPPEVEVVVSAAASLADPAIRLAPSRRPDKPVMMRMVCSVRR